jgi:hypothetical protein
MYPIVLFDFDGVLCKDRFHASEPSAAGWAGEPQFAAALCARAGVRVQLMP